LAEGKSEWQGSRSRLTEVALALLPPDRFAKRHAARIARMSAEQEENRAVGAETPETSDTVVEQRERDRATRWLAMEHAAGNPIGDNVSRTLTELRRARLIEIAYVDRFGATFPKPARGRRLSITLKRRTGPTETTHA